MSNFGAFGVNNLHGTRSSTTVMFTFWLKQRAYGKPGNPESGNGTEIRNPDPEPEPEPESGTNEWFKLGSMIDINTPPPFSAFLARWMMINGALLRKGTSIKNIVVIILFSYIEFGMMFLLYKTYLLLFVGRDKPPRNWLKCEYVWKFEFVMPWT